MAEPIQAAGVDIKALLTLSGQLATTPNADTALTVALRSGLLEDYFRLMRQRAETISKGLEATTALRAMAPPVPSPEAGPAALGTSREFQLRTEAVRADVVRAPGTDQEHTLVDFLQAVSQSIIDAQTELDMRSLSYAQQLKDTPLAPIHFSIPNVHAEVKMGFNVTSSANLLVKLFGKPEDSSNYGESTVSFDIAAAPPPPGSPFSNPIPMFLIVPPERSRVLNAAGVPAGQQPGALLLRNAAKADLTVTGVNYVAIVPHDNRVTVYRILLDNTQPAQSGDVVDSIATRVLTDIVAIVNKWLDSVTIGKQ